MQGITQIKLRREDLMSAVCSKEYLFKTRNDKNGPLQKMRDWLYQEEGGRHFDLSHMKLGSDNSDYVMLYYFEGKRYKILKDGTALVSGADADDMFEGIEKDLQNLIDSILSDELVKILSRAAVQAGAACGKAKVLGDDPDVRSSVMVGLKTK